MFEQDYIMRQIEMLTQALARAVFKKGGVQYAFPEERARWTDADVWYRGVLELLTAGDVCGAENALFDGMEPSDPRTLLAVLDFYNRLNRMTDTQLERANFSRNEALQGLRDATARCGLQIE